ncbi:MAG: hypothetical protein KC657_36640 [Myxococcales bacterium]|nr:hypothetical protein [Myxococcales bacterium]
MDPTSFQAHLLKRMTAEIRTRAAAALGLTAAQIDTVGDSCPIQIPDKGQTGIKRYEALLGSSVRRRLCLDVPDSFRGSIEHAFVLPLWPHLFWIVRESTRGTTWGLGFENQYDAPIPSMQAGAFRPELVTLRLLRQLADSSELVDGWDEETVQRFACNGEVYEGAFVWGLMQSWQRVEERRDDRSSAP